jgi:hypothetical protein
MPARILIAAALFGCSVLPADAGLITRERADAPKFPVTVEIVMRDLGVGILTRAPLALTPPPLTTSPLPLKFSDRLFDDKPTPTTPKSGLRLVYPLPTTTQPPCVLYDCPPVFDVGVPNSVPAARYVTATDARIPLAKATPPQASLKPIDLSAYGPPLVAPVIALLIPFSLMKKVFYADNR